MDSATLQVLELWAGEEIARQILEGADMGLALAAMEIVALDKANTKIRTGALRNSKRTMPPDYSQDDTAASQSGDLAARSEAEAVSQVVDHEIKVGSNSSYAYSQERVNPSLLPAVDRVLPEMDKYIAEGVSRKLRSV